MKQQRIFFLATSVVTMLAVSACGARGTHVVDPTITPLGQASATVEPTTESAILPTEAAPTAEPVATESEATATVMAETITTATPGTGSQTEMTETTLSGNAIEFNGVSFDVDTAMIPSVTVSSGFVHPEMAVGADASMAGPAKLKGMVFTLGGFEDNTASDTYFAPRIIVVPVSNYASMSGAMVATPAASSDTISTTEMMTDTKGAVMPTVDAMRSRGLPDGMSFMNTLSATINGSGPLTSSTMRGTMMFTDSMTILPMVGVHPILQTNGQRVAFKNGKGVRFVTAFGDGKGPITNDSLYYVFYGLTDDGTYQVSAILPLSSVLFADTATGTVPANGLSFPGKVDDSSMQAYLDDAVRGLDDAALNGDIFTKRLSLYDSLIHSLSIDDVMAN